MNRSCFAVGVLAVATILSLANPLYAQRADRGVITGVVTDTTGSALAGATVKIKNLGTGVETAIATNESGAYSSPLLILGSYSVTVDHPGFKTSVSSGIVITGAATVRQDITLAVGSTTESVEVVANDTVNVTTPDVSHVVDNKYYEDLPTITAADVRLAESMLQIQPGYLPMKPNGDPMFRGSQFNSRINGGQTMATENFFDGAAFGYASGHQQSQESAPPEDSIQEMKVITTTYAAQYGHTSGGFIEYDSKSGTSKLHGSAYEYFANSALNARGFFDADCSNPSACVPLKRSPVKNNAFGFTLGGPVVIPKVYNGRSKTFFFTNIDLTRVREGVLPGFGNSTPIDAFKAGDFSSLLTGNQAKDSNGIPVVDALGRPVMEGAIYNPATTQTVGGVPVRDPYPGNIIPPGDPLLSVVSSRITPLMVHPDRAGIFNNVAGNPAGDQTWVLDARNIEFRVDHDITPNFRMSETFYWNHRPSIRNCGEVAGCDVAHSGITSPQLNTDYYGNGFYQRVVTHHAHTQFEWIIRNNLSNHTTIAWDRWFMGGNPLSAGASWPTRLWSGTPGEGVQIPGIGSRDGGLVSQDSGPPQIDFSGDYHPEYNSIGQNAWAKFGFEAINRWQFSDDLTWVKNKHTLRVGFEYRWHQINHSGWATGAQGGEFRFDRTSTAGYDKSGNFNPTTGEAFASMLLGQVYSSTQTLPFYPQFYEGYFSPWINDEFKATNKLTLTFGLRFDYQRARTESQNRYSTFDPNTPNPGADGRPGAIIFAGHCPACSGRDTFEEPNHNAWGPRLGFAYRLNDKTAVRGGYGMYYSGIAFSQFQGDPTVGYNSNPTVPNISNGFSKAFFFDNGFPASDPACSGNCVNIPPFILPTVANNTSPLAVAKNGLTLPRYQNWSLTFERELVKNMRLDVSYIANKGTRLPAPWQAMGVYANMNDPSVLALGTNVLNSPCNSTVAAGGSTCAGGVSLPYSSFNGNVAQALRLYPQYQNIVWRGVPLGASMYNAVEFDLEQRVSHGLQFRVAYTYSKLHNDGSETGQSGDGRNARIQNPACPHACEWGLSDDDTPNVFIVAYTWELPGAKKWHGAAGALLGGWNFGGVLRYESGRPLNITMENGTYGGLLFNAQRRPDRVKGTSAYAKQVGSFYNPLAQNYFSTAGWSDPGANPFGTAPRADGTARGFPTYNEDMSLFKIFKLTEQVNMRFESQFGNIFNRTDFCNPSTFWDGTSATFGSIGTQCNYPRSVQFSLKFSF
jgi:Carboxypeptidase regulatory-like domain/TonB dependent receptor